MQPLLTCRLHLDVPLAPCNSSQTLHPSYNKGPIFTFNKYYKHNNIEMIILTNGQRIGWHVASSYYGKNFLKIVENLQICIATLIDKVIQKINFKNVQ